MMRLSFEKLPGGKLPSACWDSSEDTPSGQVGSGQDLRDTCETHGLWERTLGVSPGSHVPSPRQGSRDTLEFKGLEFRGLLVLPKDGS